MLFYEKIVYVLIFSANSIIPKRKKGYYKFWWTTELNELKAKAIAAHRDFLIIAPYKYSYLLTYLRHAQFGKMPVNHDMIVYSRPTNKTNCCTKCV